ncbi:MAG TPA: RNA polymerase sigma factor [Candidatus Krumholzibacteria bacterium]|nr:RNA polymerase sigma factor [Candidatus Krumholzibacteria bacterium]
MKPNSAHDLDDARLVKRYVGSGDEGAFRALYRAHTPAMLAVVWRYLDGDRTDAEDVVQEAWIRASEKLATFRWESALRTWLVGIAINCARNRARTRAANSREAYLADVVELPAAPPAIDVAAYDVQRAVAHLPEGYREVLLLHDVFGYTHDEIARMLGVESGTSKSQLSRARSSVRRWLTEKGRIGHERRSE